MANSKPDENGRGTLIALSSANDGVIVQLWADPVTHRLLTNAGSVGTVTTLSVVSANGFAGTVANATSTPAITLTTTITGILQGNGTAISAATTTGTGAVVLATGPTLTSIILAAGTAAAGTAPMKLTPGVLLAVPELGALEFVDDATTGHLYITLNVAGVLTRVQIV